MCPLPGRQCKIFFSRKFILCTCSSTCTCLATWSAYNVVAPCNSTERSMHAGSTVGHSMGSRACYRLIPWWFGISPLGSALVRYCKFPQELPEMAKNPYGTCNIWMTGLCPAFWGLELALQSDTKKLPCLLRRPYFRRPD